MKLNYKWLLAATVFATACKKIEIKPEGTVDPSQALTKEADVRAVLNACYTPLAGSSYYGGRLPQISEYLADQCDGTTLQSYEGDIYNYKSNPNGGTGNVYSEPYIVIQRANSVLENLSLVISSTATADNYRGQALFLRAISHFELVKLFGQPYGYSATNDQLGITIKTTTQLELGRPRNTVKEVYDQVLSDLQTAQTLLPATNGAYATRWAVKGYLARVFFQMNRFDSAYKYANEVITGSGATFDNTANFVTNRFNSPVTSEAVFALINETSGDPRFGALRNDNNVNISMGLPINANTYTAGTGSNDLRKVWYTNTSGLYGINKYKKNNFILAVLHLTELKLMRAECAASLNQNLAVGIADINDITNRAYSGTLAPLPAGATASQVLTRARNERKLEMIYESGDRLQQIKRIGAKGEPSFSHGNAPWNCNGMVLQFPASEFNVNINFVPNITGGCL